MTRHLVVAIIAGRDAGFTVYDQDETLLAALTTADELGDYIAVLAREVDRPEITGEAVTAIPPPRSRTWREWLMGGRDAEPVR